MSKLMTPQEVADMLGVKRRFVYAHTAVNSSDPLPFFKLGKFLRFKEDEVIAWLGEHKHNA